MIRIGIICEETPSGGRYVARSPGLPDAEMMFRRVRKTMVIDHTAIPEEMPVEVVDRALVERAVMDARNESLKIDPVCVLARSMMARHPMWSDVLKHPI